MLEEKDENNESTEETTEDETTSTEEETTEATSKDKTTEETTEVKKKDPLDDMSDGDLKRFADTFGITLKKDATREDSIAEIKKVRGIKQRRVIQTDTADTPTDKSGKDVMTKRDFEKSFETLAIEELEESQDAFDKAIVKHWDDISKRYVNHNGRDSKKPILKDIRAAAAGYFHAEGIEIEGSTDAATRISRITGLGVPSSSGRTKERKRVLQKRGGMTTWYGKK